MTATTVRLSDGEGTTALDRAWQHAALVAQLDAFAGDSPRDWFLEIRSARKPRGMQQEFVPLGELDRAREILAARARETDTYVGVAPRTRESGKADAIEHSHVLWVDIDDPDAANILLPQFSAPAAPDHPVG